MKKLCRILLTVFFISASLFFLTKLLTPKYVANVVEGALIAEYYEEEKNHDVLFIGDCEVYENFSPVVLWREYGINSYIRGSAQQLIWQSYYLLEDTLRYETPKVVVFNVLSLKYNEPQKEAYNRMSLEGMKWSAAKVKAIQASMVSEENMLDYVFPILRYHSRWNQLTEADVEYLFDTKKISHNGYYMRVDTRPAGIMPDPIPLSDYQFGENAWSYLVKMKDLCEEKGIDLILIKAPSLYPYWYEEWDQQIVDFANENELLYINFLEEPVGLDFDLDTYDAGLHLNLSGAEKLSRYFGNILKNREGITDRRSEEDLNQSWQEKIRFYEEDIARQFKEIKENKEKDETSNP